MQRAKQIISQIVEAPQPATPVKQVARLTQQPAAIHQSFQRTNQVLSQDFVDYLKTVENGSKVGYKNGKWFPHADPSGGYNIGYGHHLQSTEEYNQLVKTGLSNDQVNDLLAKDVFSAQKTVDDYIQRRYKVKLHLEPKQYQMLIDYVFNIGNLDGFPKMVDAVIRSDKDGMNKEYKRTGIIRGKKKELTGRNTMFANKFLAQAESIA